MIPRWIIIHQSLRNALNGLIFHDFVLFNIRKVLSKAIYIRLADVMCSLLVVIYPCIHLVEVWHNNKIDSCHEMNQKNHTTFHS